MLTTDGVVHPQIAVNTDFSDSVPLNGSPFGVTGTTLWGGSTWNGGTWVGPAALNLWDSATAIGQCAAIRLRVVSGASNYSTFQVNGFNVTMEPGGML